MAGVRALEELFKHNITSDTGCYRYDITVIGAEPLPNYNRIMLSPVLAGKKIIDDIILNSLEWFEEHARETGLAEMPQVGVLPNTH